MTVDILQTNENESFVAVGPAMQKVRSQAEVLAKVDVPILIVGDPGTGKEATCRLLHARSCRFANRFLKISCAALNSDALEYELFSASGASEQRFTEHSPLAICHKGTLLLNNIDEMSPRSQAKLLCLLQEQQHAKDRMSFDVRVLAAMARSLEAALTEGTLRKDLYYFLSAFTIVLPPLRERKEEIPLLLTHFMDRAANKYGLPRRDFSQAAVIACQRYTWPGNLRELENFVNRYIVSGDDEGLCGMGEAVDLREPVKIQDLTTSKPILSNSHSKSFLRAVSGEAERQAIAAALAQTKWNRRAAAKLLSVSYRTLLYKIQTYNMAPPPRPSSSKRGGQRSQFTSSTVPIA